MIYIDHYVNSRMIFIEIGHIFRSPYILFTFFCKVMQRDLSYEEMVNFHFLQYNLKIRVLLYPVRLKFIQMERNRPILVNSNNSFLSVSSPS